MSKTNNTSAPKKTGGFQNGIKGSNKSQPQNKKFNKPTYVKKQIPIAYSDFYADSIDSLYNLLNGITFDSIAIPVKMSRAEFTGNKEQKGTMIVGTIVKFNNDNTFTVSMSESNAKAITDKSVVAVRCRKDRATDEITYISELTITEKYESIDAHYKDIEEAFTAGEEGEAIDVDVDVSEETTEASE